MSDEKAPYSYVEAHDALGFAPQFKGPGMPQHANYVRPMQPMNDWATKHTTAESARHEAGRIAMFMNIAFQAGREDMRRELRRTLGLTEQRR